MNKIFYDIRIDETETGFIERCKSHDEAKRIIKQYKSCWPQAYIKLTK